MTERTPEQNQAIETHDKNLIVVAGAGSGKTYVLVERFLALLNKNPDWPLNALVAITFTRKAAQEMRDRVRNRMEEYLAAALPEQRQTWEKFIAGMSSARIDTIHGLCADILRANAAEAGVDPRFGLLDETQAAVLKADVVQAVLNAAVNDADLVPLFADDANKIAKTLTKYLNADLSKNPDDVIAWYAEKRTAAQTEAIQKMRQSDAFQNVLNYLLPDLTPSKPDILLNAWQACKEHFQIASTATTAETLDTLQGFLDYLPSIKYRTSSGDSKFWKDEKAIAQEAIQAAREICIKTITQAFRYGTEEEAISNARWLKLLAMAQEAYAQAKRQQTPMQLDFDDLEILTVNLLEQHETVRQRYRTSEFRHVMVDEFQDTNQAQWKIIQGITDIQRGGSLFVVGDPKQSIYQFRGADVSVFEDVRKKILETGGDSITLAKSFRTHQPLLDITNHLFNEILIQDSDDEAIRRYQIVFGEPMQAARTAVPSDQHEFLQIRLVPAPAKDEDDERVEQEAALIAQHIQESVGGELPVFDRHEGSTRTMNYGDVAILFQAGTNMPTYEAALANLNIPFITVSGRGYYDRQEVWDLLHLLTALHNPDDDLALAAALRSPLFMLSDNALLALRGMPKRGEPRPSLWSRLMDAPDDDLPPDDMPAFKFARDCLSALARGAGRMRIAEVLRETLDRTGYLATLVGLPDGQRRRMNAEKLVSLAETGGHLSLSAFTAAITDLSERETRESQALIGDPRAVKLMTVHASKGLEFPMVVLADIQNPPSNGSGDLILMNDQGLLISKVPDDKRETSLFKQQNKIMAAREEAEKRRKFYVAATRAQDYLVMTSKIPKRSISENSWLGKLGTVLGFEYKELQEGYQQSYTIKDQQVRVTVEAITLPEPEPTADSAWHAGAIATGQPLPGDVVPPPLTRPVHVDRAALTRHLTATQIAHLGSSAAGSTYHRQALRRSLGQDVPGHIEQISRYSADPVQKRIIGEMVHRVLSQGTIPEDEQLKPMLMSYAWEQGIIEENLRQQAYEQAKRDLDKFKRSEVYKWITRAAQANRIYRELPFIFRTEKRILHGILDVLFQNDDNSWSVVDYKTSHVPDYRAGGKAAIINHATRYHLQIGVYAAAVRQQLGEVALNVYIHYIRYGVTVTVPETQWKTALTALEDQIGNVLREDEMGLD